MRSAEALLRDYLEASGQLTPTQKEFGRARHPATDRTVSLRLDLATQRKFNSRIIVAAVSCLCCLFAVGLYLVIAFRNSPSTIVAIFGGTIFSLLVIVRWLRQLWLDKSLMDLLLYAADSLSPDELLKLVSTFYFGLKGVPAGLGASRGVRQGGG